MFVFKRTSICDATFVCECQEYDYKVYLKDSKQDLFLVDSRPKDDLSGKVVVSAGKYNVHYLKSILQKAIRRNKPETAIRVARSILTQDPTQFLRRLLIIVIEDGLLHPNTPCLIWLMVAHTKGYSLTQADIEFLLSMTWSVATCKWRDCFRHEESLYRDKLFIDPTLGQQFNNLVNSVIVRLNYGGTKADMSMVGSCAGMWFQRLSQRADDWASIFERLYPQSLEQVWEGISTNPDLSPANSGT